MSFRPTITFGICVAAGIAAGIGLARPGQIGGNAPADSAVTTSAEQQPGASPGAYGSAPADAAQSGAGQGEPATIAIAQFDFGAPITVAPGATIEVTNADGDSHTLTADGGAFDTGSISGGDAASFVAPTEPGSYTFFCSIHPSMQGALSITG